MSGTASDVVGIISDTRFMNTVSDSSTVTSAKSKELFGIPQAIVRKGSVGRKQNDTARNWYWLPLVVVRLLILW